MAEPNLIKYGDLREREDLARETLTFAKIAEIEPDLKRLHHLARMIGKRPGKYFCANEVWYSLFKPRLTHILGWDRKTGRNDLLNTSAAWDIAYQTIYHELPDCEGCSCVWID